MLVSFPAFASPLDEWVAVTGDQVSEPDIQVLESTGARTVIAYELPGFLSRTVDIAGDPHVVLALPDQARRMETGKPDLPAIRRSIIVPDDGRFAARVIDATYVSLETVPLAPSKGHFTRDIDPDSVPYTFDAVYGQDALYPADQVVLYDPYILRDFRGMVVEVNPIRYNPVAGTLEIAARLVVEVTREAPGGINVKLRDSGTERITRDFDQIYASHFANYDMIGRYTPIDEPGRLVIITYDAFRTYVDPLYDWKVQQGVPAEIYNLSEVGSTSSQIKSWIDDRYAEPDGLTYVVLVGDKQQIPTMTGTAEGADSDPCYAKCEGADDYPDLFISRISAQTPAHVQTQVAKIVGYERDPDTGTAGAWYVQGTGIASAEGSPPDYTRCDWLRDMLLGYNYAWVDQIYDPGATASEVTAALNQGRSCVNYIGHGSGTSWGTTGFNVSNIHALSNVGMLPWIIDVSCQNGDFGLSECFAEAFLRAGTETAPTGAVSSYAASTNASWVPPCDMQNHAVDLLTSDQRRTIGGLFFNGVMHAMDVNPGYEGIKLMEQYNIFGDCSMMVRNAIPEELDMQHTGVLLVGVSTYAVTVTSGGTPLEGALVCGRTAGSGELYAAGYTDAGGQVTLDFGTGAGSVGSLELTATAYNAVPDFDEASIIPPDGAYCLYDSYVVDDDMSGTSSGNGDGLPDAGESIELLVALRNVGSEPATNVTATLASTSPYATIDDDYEEYGTVPAGGTAGPADDFDVTIAGNCPDGHSMLFTLEATDGIDVWTSGFSITIGAPVLSVYDILVDDQAPGGNGNGCPEPGEQVTVCITLENTGSRDATSVEGTISTLDQYATIDLGEAAVASIPAGGYATLTPDFVVALDPGAPVYHEPIFRLACSADGGFSGSEFFSFIIGSAVLDDAFEAGEGLWTHSVVSGGADDWHMETYRSNSPTHSWKFGGAGAGTYSNNADGGLVSPPVCLGPASELSFHDWLDAEQYTATSAWDGCVVELSTDEGATWAIIEPVGGYSHSIYGSSAVPLPAGTPCWSGMHDWRQETFDLAAYENEMVQFRFRFVSDGYVAEEGWYVDDIMVSSSTTGAEPLDVGRGPLDFALAQNTPNPFNPTTSITYALPRDARVALRIYNVTGQLVRTLVDGPQAAGFQSAVWDGTSDRGQQVASGVYLYRLEAGDWSQQRTMVLLK
jgi:hypothetical protein